MGGKGDEDRISELPDESLIAILSRLNVAEAARTCVISKRWRYLWTHVTCLSFDDLDSVSVFPALNKSRPEYETTWNDMSWVDQVILQSHRGSTLEAFRISASSCASLVDNGISPDAIRRWIGLAIMHKRVEKLEIDLKKQPISGNECFSFPELPIFKTPFGVSFKSLTHLSLKYIHITDEFVEHFLPNCQLLEHLWISGFRGLPTFKVALPRLKFLHISDCHGEKKLEVCAPNLASFRYGSNSHDTFYRREIVLKHANAPSIVNLALGGNAMWITDAFLSTKRYFHQLRTLNLGIDFAAIPVWGQKIISFVEFPELISLEDLTFIVVANNQTNLMGLTSLIERSPSLRRLTLKIRWEHNRGSPRSVLKQVNCKSHHQCLKVVKISGFIASAIDTEFAMYLVENAAMLEKVIIQEATAIMPGVVKTDEESTAARQQALQELGTKVPPGAELIII